MSGTSLFGSRPDRSGAFDLIALGEVMLRLDPGEGRIHTARRFDVWEGGAEYNVARAMRSCFGLRAAIVTALADNPIGRLIEDLMRQGGVDLRYVRWVPYDGVGRTVRNGLNFVERGFGVRSPRGTSDRGLTAASKLRAGDIDWRTILAESGCRWFHTGGVFAGLSPTTPAVAAEAMDQARDAGTLVSYDLNYRPSLWLDAGGIDAARSVNRTLAARADVLLGSAEAYATVLGMDAAELDPLDEAPDPEGVGRMLMRVGAAYPNLRLAAATLRTTASASRHDWRAVCWAAGSVHHAQGWGEIEILDRVGGGDGFAAGLIFGLLSGDEPARALDYGLAHGALVMTTPGDASMATLEEVERLVAGQRADIVR